ncbi:MAG: hypothetical protein WBC82_11165, partial [Dehalococcoidia bacterium]
ARPSRITELKPGMPNDPNRCAIAQTLANALGMPVRIDQRLYVVGDRRYSDRDLTMEVPTVVGMFIREFDRGTIPELDISMVPALEPEHVEPPEVLKWEEPVKPKVKCDYAAYPDWASMIDYETVAERKAPQPA